MSSHSWLSSNVDYCRKLVNSGLEGARSGEEAFLEGSPLAPFLNDSVRQALRPAAIGACLGLLGSYPGNQRHSAGRALACGLLGGALGFGVGVAWESRRLTASVASGALKNIGRVRDEHWLERHPIDYA
ncbi:MAG: hypothetical protein LAN83_09855 [Acidobacteriia bacterium]|nr:hypothetical protein [Terriglobia bacterium]